MNNKQLANNLGIARSSIYYKPKKKSQDWHLKCEIEKVLREYPSYGYRRIATHLNINKKKIQRVMQLFGLKARRRRPKWRKPKENNKDSPVYENLLLTNEPLFPNQIWATDFTHIWFKNRWIYLCTMMDLFTRKIVGYSILTNHSVNLIVQALLSALNYCGRPTILHSDQGSEYKAEMYQELLILLGTNGSMSAKGCPWENGYQESFYNQFKIDLGDSSRFAGIGQLVYAIQKQIYIYNNQRIHSALNMAPNQYIEQYNLINPFRIRV